MVGFGLLLSSVAGYLLTRLPSLLKLGTALSVLVAFGRFLASNILIHSDFLWFVGVLFAVAVLASLLISSRLLARRDVRQAEKTRDSSRRRVCLIEKVRGRYSGQNQYAMVVEVRAGGRTIRATLVGREQAKATAVGVAAITEALWSREMDAPGVWLAEQVIRPEPFLARLAAQGIVPVIEDVT